MERPVSPDSFLAKSAIEVSWTIFLCIANPES